MKDLQKVLIFIAIIIVAVNGDSITSANLPPLTNSNCNSTWLLKEVESYLQNENVTTVLCQWNDLELSVNPRNIWENVRDSENICTSEAARLLQIICGNPSKVMQAFIHHYVREAIGLIVKAIFFYNDELETEAAILLRWSGLMVAFAIKDFDFVCERVPYLPMEGLFSRSEIEEMYKIIDPFKGNRIIPTPTSSFMDDLDNNIDLIAKPGPKTFCEIKTAEDRIKYAENYKNIQILRHNVTTLTNEQKAKHIALENKEKMLEELQNKANAQKVELEELKNEVKARIIVLENDKNIMEELIILHKDDKEKLAELTLMKDKHSELIRQGNIHLKDLSLQILLRTVDSKTKQD